ncbi:uncharacterized protein EI97DRAFT_479772 [Westerdykella ornata]|uniref:Uncharacterized protein n=1 Tax=Westerdykella ornata TaxID=318751 RepID=A0A6A6JEZ3_WESOR|nr:uncharacterized protein EI97DRAFT_479772 [Westerdykella ornata]KAF2273749.1 hypothetical protein EI97DRAFT_479772 [Westerdykella ornata]
MPPTHSSIPGRDVTTNLQYLSSLAGKGSDNETLLALDAQISKALDRDGKDNPNAPIERLMWLVAFWQDLAVTHSELLERAMGEEAKPMIARLVTMQKLTFEEVEDVKRAVAEGNPGENAVSGSDKCPELDVDKEDESTSASDGSDDYILVSAAEAEATVSAVTTEFGDDELGARYNGASNANDLGGPWGDSVAEHMDDFEEFTVIAAEETTGENGTVGVTTKSEKE